MLKDFLRDDYYSSNPCKTSPVLLRSRSRKAAETTISAIYKVINVVKLFKFSSVKSPLVLPRSFSRKLSRGSRNRSESFQDVSVTVKVKDILRWRSFRDLVEEKSPPGTTTTAALATTMEFHNFSEENIPFWCSENAVFLDENGVEIGETCLPKKTVGQPTNDISVTTRNPKGELSFEESEQHSPFSVLDSLYREDEESISPFQQKIFANVENRQCQLMQRIQEFEKAEEKSIFDTEEVDEVNATEEKAKQLLGHVKARELAKNYEENPYLDHILLDFFRFKLATKGNFDDFEVDCVILRQAKSWINGEYNDSFEWAMQYVKDMERGLMWNNKLKEEQKKLAMDLEIEILRNLFAELLDDFLT
ncbi:unnamed protein product [Fraxinus pennsylvanica]|uniref:Uncharacterized protein n=1 Tax=Fraxinus pennsylvanica TaxID=56036 RepID=A0AAD1Z8P1_9LAMI|nr:unnamed protein product [Fraxinus pennsylvanica]